MPFNIESLDDPILTDGATSFIGGMVSDSRPSIIDTNAAALLQNIDLSPNGDATTRRGVIRLGAGLVEDGSMPYSGGVWIQGIGSFNQPTSSFIVAVNKRALWKYTGSAWTLVSGYLAGALSIHTQIPVCIVQGDDCIYLTDIFSDISQWDGTTFTSLGSGGATEPPFGCTSLAWHTNRLVASGVFAQPDTVAFSDILDPLTWDTATQNINVGKGDGEPISGIVSWTDYNLLVLKRNSIWVVNADPSQAVADFIVKPITQRVGVFAWRTACQVGNDVFLLTDHGVRSILRTVASETKQDIGPALSFPVDDIIRRINPAKREMCHATVRNDRYILFLPLDTSNYCNYALVYNAITQSWSGYWTGWDATCTASRVYSDGTTRLVMGDAHGRAKEWLDYVADASEGITAYRDDGAEIVTRMKTRAVNFSDPQAPKTGLNQEIEYLANIYGDGSIAHPTVKTRNESGTQIGSTNSLSNVVGAAQRDAFDLQSAGQFRELQFDLQSAGGKLSIKRVVGTAFADTLQLQTI